MYSLRLLGKMSILSEVDIEMRPAVSRRNLGCPGHIK